MSTRGRTGRAGAVVQAGGAPLTSVSDGLESLNFGMGTVIAHRAFGTHAQAAMRAAEAEVARLEALLSRFQPTSEISAINGAAGTAGVAVSRETYQVLTLAAQYSHFCDGLFDATVGPLLDVWRRASQHSLPPEAPEVQHARGLVDYSDLVLDPDGQTAGLAREGQSLDLGGIGKGFAGDRVMQVYREHGVFSAFINLGGNVAALGTKPDGSPWRVGIRHPRDDGQLLGLVSVADKAVVTSGDYERCFFGRDGRRYHHIVDPATGYPVESGLSSVTVVAENSTAADALSTIVFVAGLEKGLALLRACPGAEAVLVDTESHTYVTRGLVGSFEAAETADVAIA